MNILRPSAAWLRSVDFQVFWRMFVPLALLVSVGTLVTYRTDVAGRLAQAASEERGRIERHADVIGFRLKDVFSDLYLVARSVHLTQSLHALSPDDVRYLQGELAVFIESKATYDQARYIDTAGMERVRVDKAGEGRAKIVPDAALQNKAQRYYVSDAMALGAGAIYLSPFDLNVEHDRIEVPHKPMIRLATPLFTADGERSGVAVLNYLGHDLLQRLNESHGSQRLSAPIQY